MSTKSPEHCSGLFIYQYRYVGLWRETPHNQIPKVTNLKSAAALPGLGPDIACGDLIEVTWRQTGLMLVDQVAPRKPKVTELRE
jgi:hypothetical protein